MYPYGQPPGGQQSNFGYSQYGQIQQPYQTGQQGQAGFPNYMEQNPTGTQGMMGVPQGMQPLQTGLQNGMPSLQTGMQTGMQGFQTGMGAGIQSAAPSMPATLPGANIPNKRLSFITTEDQANFAQLFVASLSPGEQALSGDVARQILLRSRLPNNILGDIWQAADTQRSGKLLFPEFCAAMYLCARSMRGFPVPLDLDPQIKKEVTDMVDEISFSVADSGSSNQANQFANLRQNQAAQSSAFAMPQQQTGFAQPQQTGYMQPQQTGFGLQAQQTGPFAMLNQPTGPIQAQATGGFMPQTTGLMPQTTGLMPQTTGLRAQSTGMLSGVGLVPQSTGMMPQSNGFGSLQPQVTGPLVSQVTGPLRSQLTGLQPQLTGMNPQSTGMQQQFSGIQPQLTGMQPQLTGLQPQTTGLLQPMPTGKPGQWGFSNAQTPGMDTFQNQFTPQATGSRAFVMQQRLQEQVGSSQPPPSKFGMSKEEKQTYDGIFRQWDANRSGYIDGQTAIKIFGKSGLRDNELAQIWTLCDGQNQGKLNRDEFSVAMHLIYRKLNGQDIPLRLPPELVPPSQQRINESVEKMKKFLKDSKSLNVSKSEPEIRKADASVFKNDDNDLGAYKSAARHRSVGSIKPPAQPSSTRPAANLEGLIKQVREKRLLLETADAEDADHNEADKMLDAQNLRAVDDLKVRIRSVQEQLIAKGGIAGSGNDAEKTDLLRKLEEMSEELPQLIRQIRNAESEISSTRIELMQKKFEKEHPTAKINGSGQNGAVTDSDRAAAKRKAELRARMAAITGKAASGSSDAEAIEEFEKQLAVARQQAEADSVNNEKLLSSVEQTLKGLEKDLRNQLKGSDDPRADRERRKWEEAIGVEPEVRELILEIRKKPSQPVQASQPTKLFQASSQPTQTTKSSSPASGQDAVSQNASSVPVKKESTAERIARIRAEAQRRTQEKFAKAGITIGDRRKSQTKNTESKTEHVKAEPVKAEMVSAEPNKVESIQKEPPKATSIEAEPTQAPSASANSKQSAQPAQQEQLVDDADEEEKQLKLELEAERKRVAEHDAARTRRKNALLAERDRLRKQSQQNSDDDDWGDAKPVQAETWTPKSQPAENELKKEVPKAESTVKRPSWMPKEVPKFNQESQSKATATPAVAPAVAPAQPPAQPSQPPAQSASQAPSQAAPAQPSAVASAAPKQGSFNPFFRPQPKAASNDDDWGSNASEAEDEDEESGPRGGATAQQLASLLFGTMGPQRPESRDIVPSQTATPPPTAPAAPVAPASEAAPAPVESPVAPPVAPPAGPEQPITQNYGTREDLAEPFAAPPAPPAPPAPAPPVPAPAVPFEEPYSQPGQHQQAQQYDQSYPAEQHYPSEQLDQHHSQYETGPAYQTQGEQPQGGQYQGEQYQGEQYQGEQYQGEQYRGEQYQGEQYQGGQYQGEQVDPYQGGQYGEQYQQEPYQVNQQQDQHYSQATEPSYEHAQAYGNEQFGAPSAPPPPPPVPAPPPSGAWPQQDSSEDEFEFTDAPSAPPSVPPPPPTAPPAPSGFAPPPPPTAPPAPAGFAPPPPPTAPPAPAGFAPPPPPGAPPAFAAPDASSSGGAGLGNALLGEISSGGFKLKRPSQQHISESNLGKVL